jgi:hypothetical protein
MNTVRRIQEYMYLLLRVQYKAAGGEMIMLIIELFMDVQKEQNVIQLMVLSKLV